MEGERVRSVSVAERIGGIGAGSGFNAALMA
jgi:protein-L-isoaspartate O-methyltransferase